MLHYVLPIETELESEYIVHTQTLYQIMMPGYVGLVGNKTELRKAWRECNLKGHFEADNEFDPWPFAKAVGKPREELVYLTAGLHQVVVPIVRFTAPEGYEYIIDANTGDILAQDGDVTDNVKCMQENVFRVDDQALIFRCIRK